jgi:hypothetical protein
MPRLSFTLRDVFWLTLVMGMGVGWWIDHTNLVRYREMFEWHFPSSSGQPVGQP